MKFLFPEAAFIDKIQKRHEEITPALALLEKWLDDILKNGLVHNIGKDANIDEIAKLMVDSKAKGFELMLRKIAWNGDISLIIEKIAYLSLLVKALLNFEKFSLSEKTDLIVLSGLDLRKEDVRQMSEKFFDEWILVGMEYFSERNSVEARKSWFFGQQSQKYVYFIEYQHGSPLFPNDILKGRNHHFGVHFYSSLIAERILLEKDEIYISEALAKIQPNFVCSDFYLMQNLFAEKIGKWAWYEQMPILLKIEKIGLDTKSNVILFDEKNNSIQLFEEFAEKWTLVSFGFTAPFFLFGLWNAKFFVPLSVHKENNWYFFGQDKKNNLLNK